MAARPVTDAERARVRQLHAQGMGRNEIARELGRSVGAITNIARELGLSFDRSATEAATKARQADLAELRSAMAHALMVDADKLRRQMWQQTTVYSFGGKDNEYNEHTFPEAPAADKRTLMLAASAAIDRSLKLSPPPADDSGVEGAKSMLTTLGEAIAGMVRDADTADDGED